MPISLAKLTIETLSNTIKELCLERLYLQELFALKVHASFHQTSPISELGF
jgi:hypothetical protein